MCEKVDSMASNIFNTFLSRHTAELKDRFSKHLSGVFPMVSSEELNTINTNLVSFFLGRILGTLEIEDPLTQSIIAETLETKVSPETMRNNIEVFFAALDDLCSSDPVLSEAERSHIERMLKQSHNFLLTNIFLVNARNLKEK